MKDFFLRVNTIRNIKRKDIIEKDYHIHRILSRIIKEGYLKDNLAFKGGTCLIKTYFDYYRFSEDIDFTWKDKSIWKNKTKSQVAKACSNNITELVQCFKTISDELGFDFSGDKTRTDEVHISSSGRMVDLSLGYHSEMLNSPSRIKIEINFVDENIFPYRSKKMNSYMKMFDSKELEFIFEKPYKEYSEPITMDCYDLREIFIEKCRAAMTRRMYKLRDMLDIYFIEKYRCEIQFSIRIRRFNSSCIRVENTFFVFGEIVKIVQSHNSF